MSIEQLYVFHMPKVGRQFANPFAEMGFSVETCLRYIAVSRTLPTKFYVGAEVFEGAEAYRFLLEIACGLHSKIQGESEIFGQIKKAWQEYADKKPLHTLMQHLFADTKRIRTQYLHGIGGQSYAGATQKLLNLKKTQSVLIIGAGQFGAMFATKLTPSAASITLINRSLRKHPLVETIIGFEDLEEEIARADHVLICIPPSNLDARIQAAWQKHPQGKLIHFGLMHFADTPWAEVENMLSLGDVMALQNNQSEARPQAVKQAFAAIRTATDERVNSKNRIPEAV